MDGVLCNFLKAVSNLIGKDLESHDQWAEVRDIAWPAVHAGGFEFWENLEWMPEGKELVEGVKKYDDDFRILSAQASRPEITTNSVRGKYGWLSNNIDERRVDTASFVFAVEKQTFAYPNTILIDDAPENIEQFNARGGNGIFHNGCAKDTLEALDKVWKANQ